jgi:type I restriction enzyme R subunit
VEHAIDGKAKAMIVTRSRLHAVRYAVAVRDYLKELGEPFEALVAFTGTVKNKDTGGEYTEAKMNGFAEDKLRQRFEAPQRRILIVANKYQTGFDQPLLKAMYVDRKLTGVAAVQTLSRLNRTHPGKDSVVILDFENEPKHIEKQFKPYYDRIKLTNEVAPDKLYDIRTDLEEFGLYTPAAVDAFCAVFYRKGASEAKIAKLHALVDPLLAQFRLMDETDRKNFKSLMRDYVKLYGFLSQIIPFGDPRLEKLYAFAGFVVKKLKVGGKDALAAVISMTDLDRYRPNPGQTGKIALKRGEAAIKPISYGATGVAAPGETESLSKIIKKVQDDQDIAKELFDRLFERYLASKR